MPHPPVVWITGGGTGLGRAMALAYADKGYFVAVSGRRSAPLDAVVGDLSGSGLALVCDVSDESSVASVLNTLIAKTGRLDIAIANAGFAVGGPIAEVSEADWVRQLAVNVVGVATTARLALPHLIKTQGRLALVASVAGMVYSPRSGAYSASKAAVRAMGLVLAQELHGSGVSCTTLHPGFVASEIGQVDNNGVYHADWKDNRPQAVMWPADKAARVMLRAIDKRKLEFTFTVHGRVAAWFGRHMPWLVHVLISRRLVRI